MQESESIGSIHMADSEVKTLARGLNSKEKGIQITHHVTSMAQDAGGEARAQESGAQVNSSDSSDLNPCSYFYNSHRISATGKS